MNFNHIKYIQIVFQLKNTNYLCQDHKIQNTSNVFKIHVFQLLVFQLLQHWTLLCSHRKLQQNNYAAIMASAAHRQINYRRRQGAYQQKSAAAAPTNCRRRAALLSARYGLVKQVNLDMRLDFYQHNALPRHYHVVWVVGTRPLIK